MNAVEIFSRFNVFQHDREVFKVFAKWECPYEVADHFDVVYEYVDDYLGGNMTASLIQHFEFPDLDDALEFIHSVIECETTHQRIQILDKLESKLS